MIRTELEKECPKYERNKKVTMEQQITERVIAKAVDDGQGGRKFERRREIAVKPNFNIVDKDDSSNDEEYKKSLTTEMKEVKRVNHKWKGLEEVSYQIGPLFRMGHHLLA